MKKIFRFAAALFIGALVAVACDPKPVDPDNKPDDKPDDKPEEVTVSPYKISLDGAFSDWDAITEAAAKDSPFAAYAKGGADDPIQVLKVTSDADNVYFYIEFLTTELPNNDTCSEWGDSYNGTPELGYKAENMGPDDDAFREVMHLFIDPDGDDKTGFYTFESQDPDEAGEPAIKDLGCEMCAQFFMFYKPSTKKVCVAWEQTLIGPTKLGEANADGSGQLVGDYTGTYDYNGTFCQSWPDSGVNAAFPVWGWQNAYGDGKGDNDAPRKDNWKPAPAEGNIAKVEFCIEKKDMTNLGDEDEEMACGIIFDWSSVYQTVGPLRIQYSE